MWVGLQEPGMALGKMEGMEHKAGGQFCSTLIWLPPICGFRGALEVPGLSNAPVVEAFLTVLPVAHTYQCGGSLSAPAVCPIKDSDTLRVYPSLTPWF